LRGRLAIGPHGSLPSGPMNRLQHFVHRSGHHVWRLLLGFEFGLVVLCFLPVPAMVGAVLVMVGIAVVGFAFVFGLWLHQGSLCEPCIAEMPLNGPQKAEDWDRYLAAYHWVSGSGNRRSLTLYIVWLGVVFVANLWLPVRVSVPLTLVPMMALNVLDMRHSRIRPWCKRCGWDEGGEHEFVPTPDPAASA
jgi:hypothetical protein